ncbi:hypothetical protein [Noviherbaspirillum sp. UKPF54]|uniref:hypothetical protein n=1 Tax=Noviherbaspirillum sp. UKPF54 TaxID=2601898 RepID=UPI0011B0F4D4|nr:hypothetical protein [Noviherbaspirillum sp. UKPF54]QDZ27138.1 hypothetical protein FAY22_03715 [Noviherbaspirillum sp. UKPF54]
MLILAAARFLDLRLQVFQHDFEAIRMHHLVHQRIEHQVIEFMHRHGWRVTLVNMLAQAGIAFVATVTAALPRRQVHPWDSDTQNNARQFSAFRVGRLTVSRLTVTGDSVKSL